jgi:hypothetical protein
MVIALVTCKAGEKMHDGMIDVFLTWNQQIIPIMERLIVFSRAL